MPESKEHRQLVLGMAHRLQTLNAEASIAADIPRDGNWGTPPVIGLFRPDIFASSAYFGRVVIGEAKTWPDLRSSRSEKQMVAFLSYLDGQPMPGCFTLGVFGHFSAEYSQTMLRFLVKRENLNNCHVQVYDGLDYWRFDRQANGGQWHLI